MLTFTTTRASNTGQRATRWLLAVMLAWPLLTQAYVVDDGWKLVSGKDKALQVYTKRVEGQPIKAVKAVTTLDAPMTDLLTVLSDDELVPEWIPVIGEAELLQATDADGVSVMYLITNFPWPVKNRVTVVRTVTTYDQGTSTVIMESTGVPGYVEDEDGTIRTRDSYTRWKIYPLEDGKLHVEIITHTDPRGFFPKWLMNLIVSRTPGTMFKRLDRLLEEETARDQPFDEIHVFGKEVGLGARADADIGTAGAQPGSDQPPEPPAADRPPSPLPMTGLDVADCASSERPLDKRDEGFVDQAIMGTWGWFEDCAALPGMEPDAQGLCYRPGFKAGFGEDAALELADHQRVMTGYSSILSRRRYLNLKLIDCADCSEERRAEIQAGTCPYTILQYRTGEPRGISGDQATVHAEQMALFDGRYLSVATMDRDFVRAAIERGQVDGDPTCVACAWTDAPCLTSRQRAVQAFIRQYDAQLFPPENWRAYVRVPSDFVRQTLNE